MEIALIFFALIIILIPIAIGKRKEHLSGQSGERKTNDLLSSLKAEDEEIFSNFLAARNKTGSASIQIDHIFISHKGIFVIETKDFRGRIYGSAYQRNWTQVLAYGEVKNSLYNPIMQNETHCKYVYNLMDGKYRVFNVVIFINADINRVDDPNGVLFEPYSFRRWFKSLPFDEKMDPNSIKKIKAILLNEMLRRPITKEDHIRNIRRNHQK